MSQSPRIARWAVEFLVIVASILMAFGIEAAWAERAERVEEAEVLDGLVREFRGYEVALAHAMERHALMFESMESLLVAMDAGAWSRDDLTIDLAIMRTLYPPTTELGNGVRDAMVQGGRLEIIEDRELRERLATWPFFYAEMLDDEVFGRGLVFNHLTPYLNREGYDLSGIYQGDAPWPVQVHPMSENPAVVRRLLTDPEFKSLIQTRYAFWHHTKGEYEATMTELQGLLADLERAVSEVDG